MDIVDRLRDHQNGGRRNECEEAAAEIERLRTELYLMTADRDSWREQAAARVQDALDLVDAERERCAKVCEQTDEDGEGPDCWGWHAKDYARAIRSGA